MWQTSVVRINAYIKDRLSWIHDAYPNSQVLNLLNNSATAICNSFSTDNPSRFRNIFINRLNAALADQPAEKYRAGILARPEIAKESKAWHAKELMAAEYESMYFALYDQRVPFRDTLRSWANSFLPAPCRVCRKAPESQIHVLSGCGPLSMVQYKIRHDNVALSIHQQILRAFGADYNRRYWWKKTPPRSVQLPNGGYLRWDPKLRTTSRLEHDHPDLLLNTPSGHLYIIEVTVCTDSAVATRHNEKMISYQRLADDLSRINRSRTRVLVFAIGTLGTVPEAIHDSLQVLATEGIKISLPKLQRFAAIGSVRIAKEVLALPIPT
jgi:hypothetical protein